MTKSSIKAFIHGFGSVLCLFPCRNYADHIPARLSSQASDKAAIAGDFHMIGLDMSNAMQKHQDEQDRRDGTHTHG